MPLPCGGLPGWHGALGKPKDGPPPRPRGAVIFHVRLSMPSWGSDKRWPDIGYPAQPLLSRVWEVGSSRGAEKVGSFPGVEKLETFSRVEKVGSSPQCLEGGDLPGVQMVGSSPRSEVSPLAPPSGAAVGACPRALTLC